MRNTSAQVKGVMSSELGICSPQDQHPHRWETSTSNQLKLWSPEALRGTTKPAVLQLRGEIVPSDVTLPARENQGLSMDPWAEAAAALEATE